MAEPLYRRIAADLRERIIGGELEPGSQLPSEPELERAYHVSRNTIRLAIAALANEGLVEPRQGRGTFVRERRPFVVVASAEEGARPGPGQDAFVAAAEIQGRVAEQRDFRVEVRLAVPEIAARLQVDEGSNVVVRSMTRLIDGRPWSLQESFYPADLAEGTLLTSPLNIEHGTIEELRRHGHEQVGYRDEIFGRSPTQREMALLELGPGIPVLEMFRTAYSIHRPIRLTINVYAADTTLLAYDVGDVQGRGQGGPSTG